MKVRTSENRRKARQARKIRIRKSVVGSLERPRLVVFRSLKHISVQVIDDGAGQTLASASSLGGELKESMNGLKKTEVAKKVGELVAGRCKDKGIEKVVFDRNGCLYHGRVKALADAAREAGLKF